MASDFILSISQRVCWELGGKWNQQIVPFEELIKPTPSQFTEEDRYSKNEPFSVLETQGESTNLNYPGFGVGGSMFKRLLTFSNSAFGEI